jgi:putative hydrolase of the HAD superfamily
MPLRAVIFDYGQVLSKSAEPAARARLLEITGLSPEIFDTHYWKYRLAYDRGTLNGRTFWEAIAHGTDLALTPTQVEFLIQQDIVLWASLNPVMLDWLTRVKAAGFKIAILSNMGEDLLAHMRKHFRWLDAFDHMTWSCELDMVKPEAAIYEHTLQKLGVRAEEALFLDDKIENIEGARQIGMHALLFRDPTTLEEDLKREGWAKELPPVMQ